MDPAQHKLQLGQSRLTCQTIDLNFKIDACLVAYHICGVCIVLPAVSTVCSFQ